MAQSFDADLHVLENSNIPAAALPFLNDDLRIIEDLADEPNDQGGMTALELKQTFDKAGLTIQAYLNEQLIPAVLAADATEAARAAAEAARAVGEEERRAAEGEREAAEALRREYEESRQGWEDDRKDEEKERRNAEEDRQAAELERQAAEERRQAAEEARQAETAAAVEAARRAVGPQGPQGERGEVGPPGPQGEMGPKGDSGAVVDLETGVFAMSVSPEGHLLVSVNVQEQAPPLEIDEMGHLVYRIEA